MLELQTAIRQISVYSERFERNITLDDICFQPLKPDNLECAVTSPLEYFQSNETQLNETVSGLIVVVRCCSGTVAPSRAHSTPFAAAPPRTLEYLLQVH